VNLGSNVLGHLAGLLAGVARIVRVSIAVGVDPVVTVFFAKAGLAAGSTAGAERRTRICDQAPLH